MQKDKLQAVVIEDMHDARELLIADLHAYVPSVQVVGSAGSVLEGLRLIASVKPDLVFLDIELEDGTGFEILEYNPQREYGVIFTTASDEHALRAFRFAAVDYLLKPIETDLLIEAVGRVQPVNRDRIDMLVEHWRSDQPSSKISLVNADEIKIVDYRDIVRCESDNNYCTFYFREGKFLVSKTLKSYEEILQPHGFLRCHQSHLVNLDFVDGYIKSEGGYLLMKDQSRIPVSLRQKKRVLEILRNR